MPVNDHEPADLNIRGAVHTVDPAQPCAQVLAVRGGKPGGGSDADVRPLAGAGTQVVNVAGGMLMPGLIDVHSHVGFGGQAAAWELALSPMFSVEEIFSAVRERAGEIGPEEWVAGGIVISPVFHAMGTREMLAALDEASLGRPVVLRDDSLHNRWVNSRVLEILGIDASTRDPVPLENRIWPVTGSCSVHQAACVYSLIRPPRTGFRRICCVSMLVKPAREHRVRRGRVARCPGEAGRCCNAPGTRSG